MAARERHPPFSPQLPAGGRRTFQDECDDILRLIRSDAGGADGRSFAPRGTTHEKYGAILGEVERLNRLLAETVEERDGVREELRGRLARAEVSLRERDEALRAKDTELLHMRGVVESLRMQVEDLRRKERSEGRSAGGVSVSSNRADSCENGGRGGSDGRTTSLTSQRVTGINDCLVQRLWKWIIFILEQCLSVDNEGNEKLTALLKLLSDLQKHSAKPNVNTARVWSLSTMVSNSLVEIAAGGVQLRRRRQQLSSSSSDASDSASAAGRLNVHERDDFFLQRISDRERGTDVPTQQRSVLEEENVRLSEQPKSRACASPLAQTNFSRTRGVVLSAESDQPSVFIKGVEQQLKRLEEERDALCFKSLQQTETIQRHEYVLEFLSRYGCSSDGAGGGSDVL